MADESPMDSQADARVGDASASFEDERKGVVVRDVPIGKHLAIEGDGFARIAAMSVASD